MPDSLGGSLILRNNKKLTDIMMYDKLDQSFLFTNPKSNFALVLTDNPKLSECTTTLLCSLIKDVEKPVFIDKNGPKCTSAEDVKSGCFPSSNPYISQKRITIYPNPVIDKIFISNVSSDQQNIRIINSLGQTVFYENHKKTKEILVQSFPAGVYTLYISGEIIRFTKI